MALIKMRFLELDFFSSSKLHCIVKKVIWLWSIRAANLTLATILVTKSGQAGSLGLDLGRNDLKYTMTQCNGGQI